MEAGQNSNLITIFLTGLFTGGLTCMAVQGGLLASCIAQQEQEKLTKKAKSGGNARPIVYFMLAKLVSYTLLGFLLGWFGSLFQLSLQAQVIMQFAVVAFMIGTALNLLDVHPIFRYFVIQPPKFLTRLVRKQSKSQEVFAPLLLGGFTVFIPCGTTQAMMALAIGSSNPILGAAILAAFVLGTSPVFFLLGYFMTKLGDSLHQKFMRFAAGGILLLALFNFNNALALTGTSINIRTIVLDVYCVFSFCDLPLNTVSASETVDEATITFTESSYVPSSLSVKAGSKVSLRLINKGGYGCIQGFTIPKLGIQKTIPVGREDTVTFTAPDVPQEIAFMCSMGMFRGVINVI